MDRDIELLIRPGSTRGDYRVDVVRAPTSGRPSGTLHLDVDAILDRLPELELTVLASAAHGRRSIPAQEKPLHEVGQQLFEALFSGAISAAYHASQGALQQSGQQLRLVLRLAAPELAALPWEMLFDPEDETYLCRRESLLRHIPASDYNPNPMEVEPPLRVLGIISAPKDLPRLDTDAEKFHLSKALEASVEAGLVNLDWAPQATWDGIQAKLRDGPWHVVHFIGHGDYDVNGNEGRVALVSPQGRSHMVEASGLADLLREASPSPRLVVLNSCSSGESGQEDLFSASAAALVRGGISAVAAMQFTVSDSAAIAFARGFYGAIAAGREVDEAAGSGRRSILGLGRTLEWVTPVLYVRGGSTRLFTIARSERPAVSSTPQRPAAPGWEGAVRQSTLRAMLIEAKAKARIQDYAGALSLLDDLVQLDPDFREAVMLRDSVRGKQVGAQSYSAARQAEDAGDWAAAIRWYALVENDGTYPDAVRRRVASELRLQVSDLQDELRYHADEGNWQAVLEVDAQLGGLSPADANPEGLADRALRALTPPPIEPEASARPSVPEPVAGPVAEPVAEPVPLPSAVNSATSVASVEWAEPMQPEAAPLLVLGHPAPVRAVAFSRQGAFATGCDDKVARVWPTVLAPAAVLLRHDGWQAWVNSVAFSPDGTRLASGCDDRVARIWDATSGARLVGVHHSGWLTRVFAVAWSADGVRIASAADDKSARLWDAKTGAELLQVRHKALVSSVAFSSDGLWLATGSYDKTARVWDTATGALLRELRHAGVVSSVAFTSSGTRLGTGGTDAIARVWDAATGEELLNMQHKTSVFAVAFSPFGSQLATGSSDGSARIWDSSSGEQLWEGHHDGIVAAVAFNADGTRLATGSHDKTARIWDVSGIPGASPTHQG